MSYFDEAKLVEDSFVVNDCVIIDDDYDSALHWLENDFPSVTVCPFCSKALASFQYLIENKSFTTNDDDYRDELGQKAELKTCLYCTYWQWFYEDGLDLNCYGCPDHFWHGAISKAKEYTMSLPEGCYNEISVALRRNPSLCHFIDPYELEKLIAAVFRANYTNCEVVHVGRPDDGGVDVIFIDSGNRQWLIQVKRRQSENASEGVSTIRNLLGTMFLENSSYGVVISTADHFTYRACQAVDQAHKKGMQIKLIDKGKLLRMVGPLLPDRPWLGFVATEYPDLSEIFNRKYMLLHEKFGHLRFQL
jgi:hypothetical protein